MERLFLACTMTRTVYHGLTSHRGDVNVLPIIVPFAGDTWRSGVVYSVSISVAIGIGVLIGAR